MKKNVLLIIFLSPALLLAQLVVDAGENQHLCEGPDWIIEAIALGGSPSASGGVPPYTYTWSIAPIEAFFPGSGIFFYASHFLNDTLLPNPILQEVFPLNSFNTAYFRLTVTDAAGTSMTDSVQITASDFTSHLMYHTWTINQGDSVFLDKQSNVYGGIGELSYLWQPSHGLSDTTLYTGFWAKPDSTIAYYVTVTDSMGCQQTGDPLYYINVNPLSVNSIAPDVQLKIYPNPAKNFIFLESEDFDAHCLLTITDVSGKIVLRQSIVDNTVVVNVGHLNAGMYFANVSKNQQFLHSAKWIKE